jgi:hypothetical protein
MNRYESRHLAKKGEIKTGEIVYANSQTPKQLVKMVQAATGFGLSKQNAAKSISHIVQRGLEGRLLQGVAESYEFLQNEGSISKDYDQSENFRTTFQYLLKEFEGEDVVDEKRFEAMKKIFIKAAQEGVEDYSTVYLLTVCKEISGSELLVLQSAYNLSKNFKGDKVTEYDNSSDSWNHLIADNSPIKLPAVVSELEKNLRDKSLITGLTPGGSVVVSSSYRLSTLGLDLCRYLDD